MQRVEAIEAFLKTFAPLELAEEWDNVGLLVGDRGRDVSRAMTCLTITPESVAEAIEQRADLIVTHHPLPFLPLKQLTTDTTVGRMLLELIAARIAVYSPHTAFDSARAGINQRLAQGLQLRDVLPLVVGDDDLGAGDLGAGRWGRLSEPLALDQLADRTKQFLRIEHLHAVGDPERPVRTVAVACGSAGSFLEDALGAGCDCLLTGETQFHTYLEAKARGIALLLPGHFASERFAVECLADVLSEQFTDLTVWASQAERDPVRWV